MLTMKKQLVKKHLFQVLSATLNCNISVFEQEGIFIVPYNTNLGRFNYPEKSSFLQICSLGNTTIISVSETIYIEMKNLLKEINTEELFVGSNLFKISNLLNVYGYYLQGPDYKYFCPCDKLKKNSLDSKFVDSGLHIEVLRDKEIWKLYEYSGFDHALAYQKDYYRPDKLAIAILKDNEPVAIAGATQDSEMFYQIGISVRDDYKKLGFGKFLVNKISFEIYNLGKIPLYSTDCRNILSMNLALSIGYKPYYVNYYSRKN